MAYKLSPETRESIARSTGMNRTQQTSTPISGVASASGTMTASYLVDKPKDIAPRGSIYLQMNRILSLKKVRKYIQSI